MTEHISDPLDIPWEKTADGRNAVLLERSRPPEHQKYIAIDAMRHIERVSAEFGGTYGLYGRRVATLFFGVSRATVVNVLAAEDPSAPDVPPYCVRHGEWTPAVKRRSDPFVVGPLEGTSALHCRLLFPGEPSADLERCMTELARLFKKGIVLSKRSRPTEEWTNIECSIDCADLRISLTYELGQREHALLEKQCTRLLELARAIDHSGSLVPDNACRISYVEAAGSATSFLKLRPSV